MFRRGLLGYLPVNIVQAAAGFGAIFAFTRLLSPAAYGDYALALGLTSLVHTTVFTWVESAMARFHAVETTDAGRSALLATLYRAFLGLTVLVPLAAAAILLPLPLSPDLKGAFAAGLGSIIARSALKIAQERRRAAGEVAGFAVYDIVQTGAGFGIGALLAWRGLGGAAPLIGMGVSSVLCLLFALPAEVAAARIGRFERARAATYLAYGLPVALSLVMGLALATTDRFVLAAFLDQGAVGAYHAGYSLSSRTLDILFIWLGMAGQPAAIAALERGGAPALQRLAREQASLMLLIALPAAAGVALVSRPLADLMVGPSLAEASGTVTPWIAFSALLSGLGTYYFNTAFTLARRTRLLFGVLAIPAAANLALTLLLIPRFGLMGAVWATAASYALGLAASALIGRRVLALPIPWSTLARAGAASGIMAAAVLALPSTGGLSELVLKAGAGALAYAAAAFLLDAGGVRSHASSLLHTLRPRAAP